MKHLHHTLIIFMSFTTMLMLNACSEGQLGMLLQGVKADAVHVSVDEQRAIKQTYGVIRNGEPIDHQDDTGKTRLHLSAIAGHDYLAGLLIFQGFDLNAQDINGETPLHLATRFGHGRFVSLMLNNDANPLIVNREGLTALDLIQSSTVDAATRLEIKAMLKTYMERWQLNESGNTAFVVEPDQG